MTDQNFRLGAMLMIATAFVVCTFMLAVYGQSGNFHLSG